MEYKILLDKISHYHSSKELQQKFQKLAFKHDKSTFIMDWGPKTIVFNMKTTILTEYTSDVYKAWLNVLQYNKLDYILKYTMKSTKDCKCIICNLPGIYHLGNNIHTCALCIDNIKRCTYEAIKYPLNCIRSFAFVDDNNLTIFSEYSEFHTITQVCILYNILL